MKLTSYPRFQKRKARKVEAEEIAAQSESGRRIKPQRRQGRPEKALTYISCNHHFADGFEDEAALERHTQEEHINPTRKPDQYVLRELAVMLGVNSDGTVTQVKAGAAKVEKLNRNQRKKP